MDNNNNGNGFDNQQPPFEQQPFEQQPPPPQQPPYGQPYDQQPPAPSTNGKAIAALIMGILGVIVFWIPFISIGGLVLSLVGLVLGIGASKETPGGISTAGLVLSIIGTALCLIGTITCTICPLCIATDMVGNTDQWNDILNSLQ